MNDNTVPTILRATRARQAVRRVPFAALTSLFLLGAAAVTPAARAQQLITNGDFETGALTGWLTADTLDPNSADTYASGDTIQGNFTAQSGTVGVSGTAPYTGLQTLGPNGGSNYALADMTTAGEHALYQSFTVPVQAKSFSLTFDLFNYDWSGSGGAVDASGLDYTSGGAWGGPGSATGPNQQVRVDLLSGALTSANAFTTSAPDVVSTLYGPGVDPQAAAGTAPVYTSYTFFFSNLTLQDSLTYTLRFAEVDNQAPLSVGVDNVSLQVTAYAPEPGSAPLALAGAGVAGLLFVLGNRRRRRRRYAAAALA